MNKLIIATNNQGKVREIKSIFAGVYEDVQSLKDAGIVADVEEDGKTFLENARKKAVEISKLVDCDVLADDSGLCVDALDGAPGIYSARYAGDGHCDEDNNAKLVADMAAVPDGQRGGKFVCAMVLAREGREVTHTIGEVHGEILRAPAGAGGFGYDPLFFVKEYGKTFGELPADVKNKISHRSRALAELKAILTK